MMGFEVFVKRNSSTDRERQLGAAYYRASARLREAHRAEFDDYYRDELDRRGIVLGLTDQAAPRKAGTDG